MNSKQSSMISPLLFLFVLILSICLQSALSDYTGPDCPYPCLPPPTGPGVTYNPPPSTPEWTGGGGVGYPPPPGTPYEGGYMPPSPSGYGQLPYYPPPSYMLTAPPPPNPVLPYFPFYYRNSPPSYSAAPTASSPAPAGAILLASVLAVLINRL